MFKWSLTSACCVKASQRFGLQLMGEWRLKSQQAIQSEAKIKHKNPTQLVDALPHWWDYISAYMKDKNGDPKIHIFLYWSTGGQHVHRILLLWGRWTHLRGLHLGSIQCSLSFTAPLVSLWLTFITSHVKYFFNTCSEVSIIQARNGRRYFRQDQKVSWIILGIWGQKHPLTFYGLGITSVWLLIRPYDISHSTCTNCCPRRDDPLSALAIWDTIPTTYFSQFAPGSPWVLVFIKGVPHWSITVRGAAL